MAENKKSFILYADLLNVVNKLPKEKAGELFLHILKYVNDMNPATDDLVINIAFEPIKLQLKRDLQRWESNIEQRRQAGIKSAESRKTKTNESQRPLTTVERGSTNSTVNVNDNDIIKDIKNKEKDIYIESGHLSITWKEMNKLIDKYGSEMAEDMVKRVLNYRKNSIYKSLYLTAEKWIKKEIAKKQSNSSDKKDEDAKLAV